MSALALLLALTVPQETQRWSILAVDCPVARDGEVIVCAEGMESPRMPLPDERPPPDRPRQPINEPRAALENSGRPCPPGGCTGVSLPIIPVIAKVVDEVGHALKRKHPGVRVPIPLD